MPTHEEQLSFFKKHWEGMRRAAERGGANAVIEFISGFSDSRERRILYLYSRQGLVFSEWRGKSFDAYIAVADAGIKELLRQAENAGDEETRKQRIDAANVISFNLAADLADCWPGDEAPRKRKHFERGLKAAEDCIHWRLQLDKPPTPHSLAHWAKGMHLLSMGLAVEATESFKRSLEFAQVAAQEEQQPAKLGPQAGFSVILGYGYLGLAHWIAGKDDGQALYEEAISAFEGQLGDETKKEDAQFGIAQLQTVKERYVRAK